MAGKTKSPVDTLKVITCQEKVTLNKSSGRETLKCVSLEVN